MSNKNKKKKQQNKDTKDPQKLKDLGNKAFANRNYEEAITYYSSAIQELDSDPVFFSNRAACYLEIEKFDECIMDCNRAIELKPDFVKAYFRKAKAQHEQLKELEAIETLQKGLEYDQENESLTTFKQEVSEEFKEDHMLDEAHPEMIRIGTMLNWLKDGGSEFDKLKIRYYLEDYRGVHAARDIKKGETILYVPKNMIITLEMAMSSPVGKKMYEKGLRQRLISPKHSFLSTYLMQERRKNDSIWWPYLDMLPKNFDCFPVFYKEEDKKWLEGSPFLDQIAEKIDDIEKDYELICKEVPEFVQFPIKEYAELRHMVSSRIFGIQIDGVKTDGFVAYADMLNHRRPRQTTWSYTDDRQGFIIEAMEDIKRGEQVYDSYGKKCNYRFFLNYGFINLNNDANEFPFKVYYEEDDKYIQLKKEMIGDDADFKKFRILASYDERIVHEFLSWMRFVLYDEKITLLYEYKGMAITAAQKYKQRHADSDSDDEEDYSKGFKAKDLPPLSINNEKKVLQKIYDMSVEAMNKYPTSYEEDQEILKRTDLTFNQSNSVLYRAGEKEILQFFITTTSKFMQLFDMKWKDARKTAQSFKEYELCRDYLTNSILYLIKKEKGT